MDRSGNGKQTKFNFSLVVESEVGGIRAGMEVVDISLKMYLQLPCYMKVILN